MDPIIAKSWRDASSEVREELVRERRGSARMNYLDTRGWRNLELHAQSMGIASAVLVLVVHLFFQGSPSGGQISLSLLLFIGTIPALITSATFRFSFIIFGGLVVFQSSEGISVLKLVYVIGLAIAVLVSFLSSWQGRQDVSSPRLVIPIVLYSLAGYAGLALSLLVALQNQATISNWLRDIVTFSLLVSVPVIALDTLSIGSQRVIERILVISGMLSAASSGIYWSVKRGLLDLPIDQLFLPSGWPAYALILFAFGKFLSFTNLQMPWLVIMVVATLLLLMSGSLSAIVPFAGLVPVGFTTLSRMSRRLIHILAIVVGSGVVVGGTLIVTELMGLVNLAGIQERVTRVQTLVTDPASDPSFNERVDQTRIAWNTFIENPVFGVGPGHIYDVYRPTSAAYSHSLVIDTSLSFLAKFGLVGLVFVIIGGVLYARLLRHLWKSSRKIDAGLLGGWFVASLAVLPLVSLFEDKGYSFGFMLVLALVLRSTVGGPESHASEPVRSALT
jgi:O-antigen ligase